MTEPTLDSGGARGPSLPAPRWGSRTLAIALLVVGIGLATFDFLSGFSHTAKRGILSGHPPVYGLFRPSFSAWGVIGLVLAAIGGLGAYASWRAEKISTWKFLALAVVFLLSFGAAMAILNGDPKGFVDPIARRRPADYQQDVPRVGHLGARGFIRDYPKIARSLTSVHSRTHPPGTPVVYYVLQRLSQRHLVPRAIAIAFLGSLVLVPAWFLARELGTDRSARASVLFLAVASAPAVFVFLSFDAVYATLLTTVSALLVAAVRRGKASLAVLGGVAAAAASLFTYAVAFIIGFAVIYAFASLPWRQAVRTLVLAAAGGVAMLGVMRLAFGFDLVASFRASYAVVPVTIRSYWYWLFGNIAAWLTFAGLPIAALGVWEFVERRSVYLIALFVPLMGANLTKIFPGETERIGQFAYPFLAVAAGLAFERWERAGGRRRPGVMSALVVFAALQAVVLEALFYNYW